MINDVRNRYGKKSLKAKEARSIWKRTNRSPVDPDARLSVKHEKRGRFAYFEHRIVDALHNFIIATDVTAANVPGHRILPSQLDSLKNLFGRYCIELALDAWYYNARLAKELLNRNLFVYVSYRRTPTKEHPQCRRNSISTSKRRPLRMSLWCSFLLSNNYIGHGYHEFKPTKGS